MRNLLSAAPDAQPLTSAGLWLCAVSLGEQTAGSYPAERTNTMLDLIYLLVGAAFLGACVLYAYACDSL